MGDKNRALFGKLTTMKEIRCRANNHISYTYKKHLGFLLYGGRPNLVYRYIEYNKLWSVKWQTADLSKMSTLWKCLTAEGAKINCEVSILKF